MGEEKFEDRLVAKTFYGLEEILASELKELGVNEVEKANRAVYFQGDKRLMYACNYHLRTALSILKPIITFECHDEDDLYRKVKRSVDWSQYFGVKHTFSVESTVYSSVFKHSQYASLRVKDGIVDFFREKTGKRPYIDTDNPDVLINLHISEKQITLSLNSSGESLYKRGYRLSSGTAPLNEVLAAGLIKLSGWQSNQVLVDPMCGSGTILIEAALMALQIPPGMFRKKFGFESWPDFDNLLFDEITKEEPEFENNELKSRLIGIEIDEPTRLKALANIKNAFLHQSIRVFKGDFFDYLPDQQAGVVITNPPYGKRIRKDDMVDFYKRMGNKFKKDFTGFDVWILSSHKEALKHLGLHPSRKIKLFNGPEECLFNKYEIYAGSKKNK